MKGVLLLSTCLPENRRNKIKQLLKEKKHLTVMEAGNALSGLIVENTVIDGKEFDAMWLGSLSDSCWKGKPDNEIVDFSSKRKTIEEIFEVTTKPMIVDGDTGGQIEHFVEHIKVLEQIGVSAVIIEDKAGLKKNSLLGNSVKQTLEDENVFAEKIKAGKRALLSDDFLLIARIESLIAGNSVDDAIERAVCYVKAGADGIMIHSFKKDGKEILQFISRFKEIYSDIPIVVVPTTYNKVKNNELFEAGANIVIHANQLLRSAYSAMSNAAKQILKDGSSKTVDNMYCIPVKEIFKIVGD